MTTFEDDVIKEIKIGEIKRLDLTKIDEITLLVILVIRIARRKTLEEIQELIDRHGDCEDGFGECLEELQSQMYKKISELEKEEK